MDRLLQLAGIATGDPRRARAEEAIQYIAEIHTSEKNFDEFQRRFPATDRNKELTRLRNGLASFIRVLKRADLHSDIRRAWFEYQVARLDGAGEEEWIAKMSAEYQAGRIPSSPTTASLVQAVRGVTDLYLALLPYRAAFRRKHDLTDTVGNLIKFWRDFGCGEVAYLRSRCDNSAQPTQFTTFASACLANFDGMTDPLLYLAEVTTATSNTLRKLAKLEN